MWRPTCGSASRRVRCPWERGHSGGNKTRVFSAGMCSQDERRAAGHSRQQRAWSGGARVGGQPVFDCICRPAQNVGTSTAWPSCMTVSATWFGGRWPAMVHSPLLTGLYPPSPLLSLVLCRTQGPAGRLQLGCGHGSSVLDIRMNMAPNAHLESFSAHRAKSSTGRVPIFFLDPASTWRVFLATAATLVCLRVAERAPCTLSFSALIPAGPCCRIHFW
jgi:hypothetical protein